MGRRGLKEKGYPNPLLERRRRKPPVDSTGRNIRNYLARPRPTLEEVKKMIDEKESRSKSMYEFEAQQAKDFRKELDKYRKKMMKRQAKKEKKEKKKQKKAEKHKKKRKRDSDDSSSEDDNKDVDDIDNKGASADSSTNGNTVDGITSTNATTDNEKELDTTRKVDESALKPAMEGSTGAPTVAPKKSRWDEKPEVFKNLPTNTILPTPVYNTILPSPQFSTIPANLTGVHLPFHPILHPTLLQSALLAGNPFQTSILPSPNPLFTPTLRSAPLLPTITHNLLYNNNNPK